MGLFQNFIQSLKKEPDLELLEFEKKLKKEYAKKEIEAKYKLKLEKVQKGQKSGLMAFGDSLLRASDKVNGYDFGMSKIPKKYDLIKKK